VLWNKYSAAATCNIWFGRDVKNAPFYVYVALVWKIVTGILYKYDFCNEKNNINRCDILCLSAYIKICNQVEFSTNEQIFYSGYFNWFGKEFMHATFYVYAALVWKCS
jgi:hypothetical protein